MRRMFRSRCSLEKPSSEKVLAHDVAVEQRHRAPAHLHQLDHQRVGDGRFARAGEAGEEHGEALLGARRLGAAQFLHHFGEGEPFGDLQPFGQAAAQFGAGDVEDGHVVLVGDLVRGLVLGAFLHIDHVFEIDHFDAHLVLMLAEQVLRVVGAVEILAGGVLAGAGVVAADDEMGAAVVLADQPVPDRLARAGHAHGKVQQGHRGGRRPGIGPAPPRSSARG